MAEVKETKGNPADRFGGKAGPGRPKGVPNKTTTIAKDALAYAFDKLGGQDALVDWANADPDNRKIFYQTIWPKLLPLQVAGSGPGGEHLLAMIERRIIK